MSGTIVARTCALALAAALPAQAPAQGPAQGDDGLTTQQVTCTLTEANSPEEAQTHLAGICAVLRDQPAISTLPAGYQLSLTVDMLRADLLRAHLDWQSDDDSGTGPTLDLGFLDSSLSPQHYEFVVTSLINATNLPSTATNRD